MQAAALFVARTLCLHFGLTHPSIEQILSATGAKRSRAYELCAALIGLLPTLARPCGRPVLPTDAPVPASSADEGITAAVLSYVLQHPGCATAREQRQGYSDDFRHFIVRLHDEHPGLALEDFARRCAIPLGTIKPWITSYPKTASASSPGTTANGDNAAQPSGSEHSATLAQIETVLTEWKTWHGTFVDFADYVRNHLRVPMGRHLIAEILEVHGVRLPRKRPGRSPDELALRGAFETFFPGAQWVGDGMQVPVVIDGESFSPNLQLEVDAHTAAWVGLSVRDNEDSTAVTESFQDGVATTGRAPLAQLLDNKPCNHTPEVDAVLKPAGTTRIRATPERPQNKAHVEGAFGLFSQQVPPIALDTSQDIRGVARALLLLVSMTFARAINHRPRVDRGGRSRFELYGDKPTSDQIQQARSALEERCRKQELARLTLEARQRPEIRALLDDHFERLGLLDPERHIRLAISRHPRDAIVDGIAIFTGRRCAGTLPEGVDARYLFGIVRNVAAQREGECVAEALLTQRLEARDRALALLEAERTIVCEPSRSARDAIADCVALALGTDRKLDRLYWLGALAGEVQRRAATEGHRHHLYDVATRDINTTFRVSPRERQDALRFLADRLVPLN
ncbi:MAG: hypothetical protein ACLPXZ_00005 [Mycobacterium sp.]